VNVTDEAEPSRQPRAGGRRFLIPALGGLAAVALLGLLTYGVFKPGRSSAIDDGLSRQKPVAAPAFRLAVLREGFLGPRLTGRIAPALADRWVVPAELRGTPYVMNIWASWCAPCRDEAPALVRAWRKARARGVLFVGLDMEDNTPDARKFMDEFAIDYLNVRDPSDDTLRSYGGTGIPETYFVDARGRVVNHVVGVVTAGELRRGIAAAVSGRPEAARLGGDQRQAR